MPRVFYTAGTGYKRGTTPSSSYTSEGTSEENDSEAATDIDAEIEGDNDRKTFPASSDSKPPKKLGTAITRQRPVIREVRDATGRKPLQKACQRKNLAKVLDILAEHPNIEDRDYAGTTALHTAALLGESEIVKALLDAGAVVDVRSGPEELDTPLMDAVASGSVEIVKMLLEANADPRILNATGRSSLDFVNDDDDDADLISDLLFKRAKELRSKGIEIIDSYTHPKADKALFPAGFTGIQRPGAPLVLDVTKKATKNEIIQQAGMGNMEYVGVALERGWKPTSEALIMAAKYGHSEVVGLLLAFGLSPNESFNGTTPLLEAVRRYHTSTAKLLINSDAKSGKFKNLLLDAVKELPDSDELKVDVLRLLGKRIPSVEHPNKKHDDLDDNVTSLQEKDEIEQPKKAETTSSEDKSRASRNERLDPENNNSQVTESGHNMNLRTIDSDNEIHVAKHSRKHREGTESRRVSQSASEPLEKKSRNERTPENEKAHRVGEKKDDVYSRDLKDSKHRMKKRDIDVDVKSTLSKERRSLSSGSVKRYASGDVKVSSKDNTPSVEPFNKVSLWSLKPAKKTKQTDIDRPSSTISTPSSRSSVSGSSISSFVDTASDTPKVPPVPDLDIGCTVPEQPVRPKSTDPVHPTSKSLHSSWIERSQELEVLAKRKEKERRDREAKMLNALAEEQKRNSSAILSDRESSESSRASSVGPQPPVFQTNASNDTSRSVTSRGDGFRKVSYSGIDDHIVEDTKKSIDLPHDNIVIHPDQNSNVVIKDETSLIDISNLPYALRVLASTHGKRQDVAPIYAKLIGDRLYYIDIQVGLSLGLPKLHDEYPKLGKLKVNDTQKDLLWMFCLVWLAKPGCSSEELDKDRQAFLNMNVHWVAADEIDPLFESPPSTVLIDFTLKPVLEAPRPSIQSSPRSLPTRS